MRNLQNSGENSSLNDNWLTPRASRISGSPRITISLKVLLSLSLSGFYFFLIFGIGRLP